MGQGPSTGFHYPTNIPNIYRKDLNISYEVESSLIALVPGVRINLSIVPSLIPSLTIRFPEITFSEIKYGIYEAHRQGYGGDINRCCITGETYYFNDNYILTCNPIQKNPSATRSCDVTLSNYCFNHPTNTHVCQVWLEGYIRSLGYNTLMTQGYEYCKITDNPFCNEFLTLMRQNPDGSQHDRFIDQVRDNTFKCSYPNRQTIRRARGIPLPRVCWDPNCIASPEWKMKYIDYITRGQCNVTSSYVNFQLKDITTIDSLTIEDSESRYKNYGAIYNTKENLYTQALKDVGRGFIDIPDLRHLIYLSLFIILIAL